jgi:hypothetical protein
MATRRYGQNPQYRVILWSYRLICGALLVQLRSRTYRFRAYFVPTPQWHIFSQTPGSNRPCLGGRVVNETDQRGHGGMYK